MNKHYKLYLYRLKLRHMAIMSDVNELIKERSKIEKKIILAQDELYRIEEELSKYGEMAEE